MGPRVLIIYYGICWILDILLGNFTIRLRLYDILDTTVWMYNLVVRLFDVKPFRRKTFGHKTILAWVLSI